MKNLINNIDDLQVGSITTCSFDHGSVGHRNDVIQIEILAIRDSFTRSYFGRQVGSNLVVSAVKNNRKLEESDPLLQPSLAFDIGIDYDTVEEAMRSMGFQECENV